MSEPTIGFIALGMIFVGVLTGYPMAFTLLFIALIAGLFGFGDQVFYLLNYQFFGLMRNTTMAAIPLFLFMGYMLEQSGLMDRVFRALRMMLGQLNGSLYLIVLLVAVVMAAATGIVGASITVLGVMAAPIMQKCGYQTRLSAGTLAAGGTLGILIPPSIMLIVMGPVVGVPVSDLFTAAIIPGLLLGAVYVVYTLLRSWKNPALGPPMSDEEVRSATMPQKLYELAVGVVPVLVILGFTLGVIIMGIATPTDAAATGALASFLLALSYGRLTWDKFRICLYRTIEGAAFILFLLAAANFFGAVFSKLGSAQVLTEFLSTLPLSPLLMLVVMLAVVFVLGSPLEWIPIVLVVVPIFLPTVDAMGYDPLWFSILVAVVLQTSWLTPPMALASYFLKGVVPDWSMGEIYVGMLQFVGLQILVVGMLIAFPQLVLWLPSIT